MTRPACRALLCVEQAVGLMREAQPGVLGVPCLLPRYFSFEGRTDASILRHALATIAPRALVLLHGSLPARADLGMHAARELMGLGGRVLLPVPGEPTDASAPPSHTLVISDALHATAAPHRLGGSSYGVALVEGAVTPPDPHHVRPNACNMFCIMAEQRPLHAPLVLVGRVSSTRCRRCHAMLLTCSLGSSSWRLQEGWLPCHSPKALAWQPLGHPCTWMGPKKRQWSGCGNMGTSIIVSGWEMSSLLRVPRASCCLRSRRHWPMQVCE